MDVELINSSKSVQNCFPTLRDAYPGCIIMSVEGRQQTL